MKKIDPGQAIAVLANLGVIAGILFLALELQQNNELIAAEGRINRTNQVRETWDSIYNHPQLAELLIKDRSGAALTAEEEFRLNGFWMSTLLGLQWQFQEDADSLRLAGMTRNLTSYGSLRRTWQGSGTGSRAAGKDNFDPDFIRFLEASIPEIAVDSVIP